MAATILYVHGNGNKVRKELLKSRWDHALFGQDMGVASRVAYWAPLRHPVPLPDHRPEELPAARLLQEFPQGDGAAAGPEGAHEFIERTLREAAGQAVTEGRGGYDDGGRADAGPAPGETALAAWLTRMTYAAATLGRDEDEDARGAEELLPLPAVLRVPVFKEVVRRTFVDVHAYFFGGIGPVVRDTVRAELAEAGDGPLVVVGHSLGSVVAYEVLREEGRPVSLFVSVGSPLGITEVQDLLARPPAVPAGVAAWRNVSDLRDVVALDHWLRPEYAPAELVSDHLVDNRSKSHHGIREYLASAPVRVPVRALFGRVAADRRR
ncbi:hypothetical protein [Streptomyces sp. NPDC090022]|uniref:hypothetical protein n=1 Tax=Streptomyces sp. NPDC090022 TaxID=3365920 RepID=UPI00381C58AA